MKIATVQEFQDKYGTMFRSHDPPPITRCSRVVGLYLSSDEVDQLPFDLHKELRRALASSARQRLKEWGLNEDGLP